MPLLVVAAFLAMSIATYQLDLAWSDGRAPAGLAWLGRSLGDNQALSSLLTTIASSIITVTSITFSLLLIAVQQGASALTAQVTDQFLMRRTNQFYFGFFVGLSVFVLVTLVTNSSFHRPIFGATFSLVGTAIALCMIVVMIYNTIEQMRPEEIVRAIHTHILSARRREVATILAQTRRESASEWPIVEYIRCDGFGYVAGVDIAKLKSAAENAWGEQARIDVVAPLGQPIAAGDALLAVRLPPSQAIDTAALERFADVARAAVTVDAGRDLRNDPAFGLTQLAAISWTSVSTAKSNPGPGIVVVHAIRDILMRWTHEDVIAVQDAASPIAYPDEAPDRAIAVLEDIIVVTSESMQAQTLSHAFRALAQLLEGVHPRIVERLSDTTTRAMSSLGEHVLTRDLDTSLMALADAFRMRGQPSIAQMVSDAHVALRESVGHLNSRSTRVPARG